MVTSGLVTDCFPQGRGERMPASCIEVAMDSIGGMSGGPVVNDEGWLVGICSGLIYTDTPIGGSFTYGGNLDGQAAQAI